MLILKLVNPADEFSWYGMCPVTHQPVLVAIREK